MSVRMTPGGPLGQLSEIQYVDAAQVLEGAPEEKGALYFERSDGAAAGVWSCGKYRERIDSYPCDEMCTVIEGTVTITPAGGVPSTYSKGDTFLIRKGFKGTWETNGPFKKYFFLAP